MIPDPASPALLDVRELTVSFGPRGRTTTVVRGISFSVRRGETVAIVGESGSGKSVSALAIMGLIGKGAQKHRESVEGRILFSAEDGRTEDLAALDKAAMRAIQGAEIAMVFQEPMTSLNPVLRIGEQIAESLIEHRSMSRARAWDEAETLLDRVGIPDARRRLRSYPHQLSGGMRQRVMIAIALSCRPSLLIADEPTTALDVTIQAQILELIAQLKAESQSAILFITHDLGVVSEIADRIVVMYAGHIVELGPAGELLRRPLHPYTRGLIDCVPRIVLEAESRRELSPIAGVIPDPVRPPAGCPFHPRCAHAVSGRCDSALPDLDEAATGREVRCLRWREIA